MVISTIGDPKVIYMDEPTTGMDPVNRRHVWAFIEKFKQGRVIILVYSLFFTLHFFSMM